MNDWLIRLLHDDFEAVKVVHPAVYVSRTHVQGQSASVIPDGDLVLNA